MGRMAVAAVAVVAMVSGVSGCGEDPEPTFSHSVGPSPRFTASSAAAPSSADPSPAKPTPPVMPQAARKHTVAGAKAFVEHVWATVNYSQSALNPAPLRSLMSPSCGGCKGGIDFLVKVKKKGGFVKGGVVTLSGLHVRKLKVKNLVPMEVTFTENTTRQVITYRNGNSEVYPGGRAKDRFTLFPVTGGWSVVEWVPIT